MLLRIIGSACLILTLLCPAVFAAEEDAKATGPDGTTALHWAVRADDLQKVESLLRAGANANAVDRYGITPLNLAAVNGNAQPFSGGSHRHAGWRRPGQLRQAECDRQRTAPAPLEPPPRSKTHTPPLRRASVVTEMAQCRRRCRGRQLRPGAE